MIDERDNIRDYEPIDEREMTVKTDRNTICNDLRDIYFVFKKLGNDKMMLLTRVAMNKAKSMIRKLKEYKEGISEELFPPRDVKKVLIGGFFDVIHSGHLQAMDVARSYGNWLEVNISPDKRAREKKGVGRPFFSLQERMFQVLRIKGVNSVSCVEADDNMSGEDYTKKMISALNPSVFVYSYISPEIQHFCESKGIKYVYLPEIPAIDEVHSTDIINKIRS